ncbi:uncharacterized protein SPPG_01575 [Spizellomyces punctatus DAOM BR117]|uniref:Uncharacterized protein n=1 Tax=Spizellomyces punctatus (strain DAOM BR117) TaxID=645134 RepID=A0A0L0HTB7_SPIPD|nr:uncharacterized protein SPPG_01575 [Spizellomyces punctatus DAOM BR117]KND04140.1 hypothetical protein SPPG_01575 [Spizellomyces punctatus DAOM BR117]|eukprot:XP_016612179.1 hypothetical protein SPPG_01575 [Spizellomyces punctatus DAOM BR117]
MDEIMDSHPDDKTLQDLVSLALALVTALIAFYCVYSAMIPEMITLCEDQPKSALSAWTQTVRNLCELIKRHHLMLNQVSAQVRESSKFGALTAKQIEGLRQEITNVLNLLAEAREKSNLSTSSLEMEYRNAVDENQDLKATVQLLTDGNTLLESLYQASLAREAILTARIHDLEIELNTLNAKFEGCTSAIYGIAAGNQDELLSSDETGSTDLGDFQADREDVMNVKTSSAVEGRGTPVEEKPGDVLETTEKDTEFCGHLPVSASVGPEPDAVETPEDEDSVTPRTLSSILKVGEEDTEDSNSSSLLNTLSSSGAPQEESFELSNTASPSEHDTLTQATKDAPTLTSSSVILCKVEPGPPESDALDSGVTVPMDVAGDEENLKSSPNTSTDVSPEQTRSKDGASYNENPKFSELAASPYSSSSIPIPLKCKPTHTAHPSKSPSSPVVPNEAVFVPIAPATESAMAEGMQDMF